MRILAVDPGVHACGCAQFLDGVLVRAWYGEAANLLRLGELIIEMPRIYPGSGQRKGDLNDLLDLAAVVGAIEERFRYCECITRIFPAMWKGQVPKKVMTARILSKLSPKELSRIERVGSKDHNTIDAIGIGLYRLGRLK